MTQQQTIESPSEPREQYRQGEHVEHGRPNPRVRRRVVMLVLLGVLGAVVVFVIWRAFFAPPRVPANVVVLSGRIEGDDSAVAPKTSGRILDIRVREGDTVKANETIAVLDDQQVRAREEQARAGVQQAEAREKSARDQIAVLEEQL